MNAPLAPRFRNGILALLLLGAPLGACQDPFQTAAANASLADSQLAAGNLDEARESIRRAIAVRDDVAAYYVLLGRIELQAQRPASALNAYSLAADLQADNPEILQSIAELGLQTGRVREASDAADRMLLLAPGSPRAMLVKGFIAIDNGRLDEAERLGAEILALNPDDEGGIILSARVEALRGKVADARTRVERAVAALGPTDALSITLLEIYRVEGDAKGMQEVFPRIVKSMADDSSFRADYINLLYKTGDVAAARRETLHAIQLKPNDRSLWASLTGLWLEYDRRPFSEGQIAFFAESGTRTAQLSLARFYLDIDEPRIAQRLIARPDASGVPEARALKARILLALRDVKAADNLAASILAADPREKDALLVRSARHLAKGNIDRAIEDANLVVAEAPEEFLGYIALANAYVAQKNDLRARQVFERGSNALPQHRMLADAYATFLLERGDTQRAVSLYQDLGLAKPSSTSTWSRFAQMCRSFGDGSCARRAADGLARAQASIAIDPPPGTPHRRGLFARITPEQICASTGGLCTGS